MYTKKIQNLDFILIILVLCITVFGIIAIGSATHINWPGADTSIYKAQIKWLIIGIGLMTAATAVNYEFFGKFYLFAYAGINFLLIVVLFVARTIKGAARWIEIGGFTLQPSEFAKVIMIFCIAKLISIHEENINKPQIIALIISFTLIPDFLVYKQPSLSVSLVIIAIMATQLFVSELSYKYIFAFISIILPCFTLIILDIQSETPIITDKLLEDYHVNRILALKDPEKYPDISYQSDKSITAMGSGQLEGKGLYEGTLNQISDLPEQHNDFIFTIVGEEFGFIGCTIVLSVLFLIILRCSIIAYKAYDTFGRLIAAGTAGMLAFQTFVHCGVTMAFLPTTGMGLPFLSYGGSSLLTNFIAIGLVLNVGMKQPKSFFEGS